MGSARRGTHGRTRRCPGSSGGSTHKSGESSMGLLSKLTKSGVAKKAMDEARKPENQQKLKDLAAKKSRDKGGKAPR